MGARQVLGRGLLGLGVAGTLLAAAEGVLRLAGVEAPQPFFLSVPDAAGTPWRVANPRVGENWFRTPDWEPLVKVPRPQAFREEKSDDVLRVFVIGESSAYGTHLDDNATWARQLEQLLDAATPDRRVEVVNASVRAVSVSIYQDVIPELRGYAPDLVVLWGGHNAFYGVRPPTFPRTLRLWRMLETATRSDAPVAASERVGLRADWQVPPGDPVEQETLSTFVRDLDRIVDDLRGVPLLVAVPPANERHLSPLCSVAGGESAEADALLSAVAAEPALAAGAVCERVAALRTAAPRHAATAWMAGSCAVSAGDASGARGAFQEAMDLDCVPVRIRSPFRAALAALPARHPGQPVAVFDPGPALVAASEGGAIGHETILDHVHLSILGSYFVARSAAETILARSDVFGVQGDPTLLPDPGVTFAALRLGAVDEYRVLDRAIRFFDISVIRGVASVPLSRRVLDGKRRTLQAGLTSTERSVLQSLPDPAADPHPDLVAAFDEAGDPAGALEAAWGAVLADPGNPAARLDLATRLRRAGDREGAREQALVASVFGARPQDVEGFLR